MGEGDGEDDGAEQVAPGLQLDLEEPEEKVQEPEEQPVNTNCILSLGRGIVIRKNSMDYKFI